MSNERITENIVRDLLKGYDFLNKNVIIEEQKSANPSIDKYLKNASKKGSGRGYPEFIISFVNDPDKLIIIECKADIKNHESINRDRYSDYAVDGVLLYTSFLKNNFNVISIAISGQNNKELKISSFLWLKGNLNYFEIDQKFNTPKFYFELIDKKSQPFKESDLIKNAIDFNKFLHNFSIPEVERCTLISAILVALQDAPFQHSYKTFNKNEDLIDDLIKACKRTLVDSRLGIDKTNVIIDEYSKFKNNISFKSQTYFNKKTKKDEPNTILRDFITKINMDVFPYVNKTEFDIVGKFYTHFIRYAGSDKNTGLVLTPSHITDLFCDIANLSVNDIVFDECCGTGGFLVSSMNYMINLAKGDEQKIKNIKKFQLVGIEKRSDMFSHACSNMMMRGDGKSNIIYGDCFKKENTEKVKSYKPTVAFLNPPYQDGNSDEQLEFVENALDCLEPNGTCISICQMSTTVSDSSSVIAVKERLLKKHTLEATFSMPTGIFHPLSVNTVIIVFTAHKPHPIDKKTFFGFFRDDGFIKTKNMGRVDRDKKWSDIKKRWLDTYFNKKSIPELSVTKIVNQSDEWCAEAYMETDYSKITPLDFEKTLKDYISFKFLNSD